MPEADIRALAKLYAGTKRCFLRAGVGFTRARNGAATMHAVSCLAALTGTWMHEGGGGFFYALDGWGLDTRLAWANDLIDPRTRVLDQSRIGAVLNGEALAGGPPVTAMLIQNANSAEVAPDSHAVRRGLLREDLFVAVHEHFMTPTAALADIVLPATTFLEHDDLYLGLGHTAMTVGPRVIAPVGEARSNHAVVCALAERLGAAHPGFGMTEAEVLDATLQASGKGSWAEATDKGFIPAANEIPVGEDFAGFPHPGGRFRFRPDWAALGPYAAGMPGLPSYWLNLRGSRRGDALPADHPAGAELPQHQLHRDAGVPHAGKAARRCGCTPRTRTGSASRMAPSCGWATRGARSPCGAALRRAADRGAGGGGDLAQRRSSPRASASMPWSAPTRWRRPAASPSTTSRSG